MVSHVQYRSFMNEDFEDIAEMLRRVWHDRSRNELYNTLEARYGAPRPHEISPPRKALTLRETPLPPQGSALAKCHPSKTPFSAERRHPVEHRQPCDAARTSRLRRRQRRLRRRPKILRQIPIQNYSRCSQAPPG